MTVDFATSRHLHRTTLTCFAMVLCLIITFKFSLVNSLLYWLFLHRMFASLTMSQIHECYVSANMDAIKNQGPAVFSVTAAHGLVQNVLLNHGQLIGTLHHHASVTTFVAATTHLNSVALGDCLQTDFSQVCPFTRRLIQSLCA